MTATAATAADLLTRGEITVNGRLPRSSNVTLLVTVALPPASAFAVYKPERGERPLWDFPRGLFKREIAAYELSQALGWSLVPLTIRREGPLGDGSFQMFVHADFEQHYFTLIDEPGRHAQLKRICTFDLLANNADRKSGHCLLVSDHIYAVDNGLCFHAEPKLRTVIWDFAGEPIPQDVVQDLRRFRDGGVPAALATLLTPDERTALLQRATALIDQPRFPVDPSGTRYPWPLV